MVGVWGFQGEDAEPDTVRTWDPLRDARGLRAEALADAALDLARDGEEASARRAAADALACLPSAGLTHAFRVRLRLGEAYLALGRVEAACAHLEAAVHLCEGLGDPQAAAEARFAFGCARLQRRPFAELVAELDEEPDAGGASIARHPFG